MSQRILLIDNYDSFTYNLVQAFLILGAEVDVHRNDAIDIEQALAGRYTHLVISPGPGTPRATGRPSPDRAGKRPPPRPQGTAAGAAAKRVVLAGWASGPADLPPALMPMERFTLLALSPVVSPMKKSRRRNPRCRSRRRSI